MEGGLRGRRQGVWISLLMWQSVFVAMLELINVRRPRRIQGISQVLALWSFSVIISITYNIRSYIRQRVDRGSHTLALWFSFGHYLHQK